MSVQLLLVLACGVVALIYGGRKKLDKIGTAYGMTSRNLESMKPWVAALLLSAGPLMKAGYDPSAAGDKEPARNAFPAPARSRRKAAVVA